MYGWAWVQMLLSVHVSSWAYLDGSSRTGITAERLDGRRVELCAGVRPEDELVVDGQVAVDPAADPSVLVRAVGAARRAALLVVHYVVPDRRTNTR